MIRLGRETVSAMAGEARARYPEECVGALVGRPAPGGDGDREVVRVALAGNERTTERRRRYLLGPARLLEIDEEARGDGLEVVGFFHSHPDHPAEPSEFDREHAWPWYSYVIVPVRNGVPGTPRAWTLRPDRGAFEEEPIVIEEGP